MGRSEKEKRRAPRRSRLSLQRHDLRRSKIGGSARRVRAFGVGDVVEQTLQVPLVVVKVVHAGAGRCGDSTTCTSTASPCRPGRRAWHVSGQLTFRSRNICRCRCRHMKFLRPSGGAAKMVPAGAISTKETGKTTPGSDGDVALLSSATRLRTDSEVFSDSDRGGWP